MRKETIFFTGHFHKVIKGYFFPSELYNGYLVKPKNINKNQQVSRYCADLPPPVLPLHCTLSHKGSMYSHQFLLTILHCQLFFFLNLLDFLR